MSAASGKGGAGAGPPPPTTPSPTETESPKSYGEILEEEIWQGLMELRRPAGGLLLSGLSAGLDLGFSVFLMAVVLTLMPGELPGGVVHILVANMYAVGFIFVILGRSELFTEHTTLAVFPVLGGRTGIRRLGRLWGLVYAANLAGAIVFAAILATVGPFLRVIEPPAFDAIAGSMVDHRWWVILLSALLAGWLMGLLSWLVSAARDTISRVFFVWLVTASIGFGELHHCILGSVEVLVGVFGGRGVALADYGVFLFWTTLGNAVGGTIFVALIKYSHAVQRQF